MTKKKDDVEIGLKEHVPGEECPPCDPCDPNQCCDYFDVVALKNASDDMLKKCLSQRLHELLETVPLEKLICELECRGVDVECLKKVDVDRPF